MRKYQDLEGKKNIRENTKKWNVGGATLYKENYNAGDAALYKEKCNAGRASLNNG